MPVTVEATASAREIGTNPNAVSQPPFVFSSTYIIYAPGNNAAAYVTVTYTSTTNLLLAFSTSTMALPVNFSRPPHPAASDRSPRFSTPADDFSLRDAGMVIMVILLF